jgi:hypothetical protein
MESFLQDVPPRLHKRFWKRLRIVAVGNPDDVTPFPIYYRTGAETLREVAERFIDTLRLAHPNLVTQASVTWPNLRRVGINTGMVLSALGFQLTEAEDLLFNTAEWERTGRFQEAINRCPEVLPAVSYFRNTYLPLLSRAQKTSLTSSFLDHVFQFSHDPKLRLWFGASTPGLWWADADTQGEKTVFDFSPITDPSTKRFAMLWIFLSLYEYLKQWGRKEMPFVIMIDEFADLTQQVSDDVNPLAQRLDEFLNQYMRNNRIWFTCAFQSISQLDEQLRHTILSLGNLVIGRATMPDARVLADMLWKKNPYMAKEYAEDWKEEIGHKWEKTSYGYHRVETKKWVLVDVQVRSYLSIQEQLELFAQRLESLKTFEFFLRPALREGTVSQDVIPISTECLVRDSKPNDDLITKYRTGLTRRGGIPAETIRAEQEARLAKGVIQRPSKPPTQPVATPAPVASDATPATGEEIRLLPMPASSRRMEDEARPVPQSTKKTQSLPTLDEHQKALLAFLIEHPDTPISGVYKGLGVSVRKGNEIRDSLKEQGFLLELELRSGATGAGRPMKCIMPSFQTFEQLGIAPPKGRGSIIHRQLQQMVAEGAGAKGYSTQKEKVLDTGAIVDVHLEKGQERIAVEIAIASWPELEIAHIKHCISFGYEKVFGIFADENLLARTAQLIEEAFSADVAGRIRLLPVSKISQLAK